MEDYCAQEHSVEQAGWLVYSEGVDETAVVGRMEAYRWQPVEDHWLVSMEDSFEQEAAVHIRVTQAV